MDKTKLRNDLFLIFALLLVTAVALIVIASRTSKDKLIATITVENNVVEVVDLSKSKDQDFIIDGTKGKLHVHTHDGAIAVIESNCPHQDCVHMGYVSETNRPIICVYNAVCILIEGATPNDVDIGR